MMKRIILTGAALALVAGAATANAATKVRLTLDWVPQSTHGPSFIAQYEGYFKKEGLDVKIDAGKGSADAVRKLVSGTHDLGWADINAIIQYNSKNPKRAIKTVLMLYEQPPFSICVLAKSSVTKPQMLAGKTLGAPVFDASYKLFPAFAKAIGIDPNSVKKTNMDPRLREPMLLLVTFSRFLELLEIAIEIAGLEMISGLLEQHGGSVVFTGVTKMLTQ